MKLQHWGLTLVYNVDRYFISERGKKHMLGYTFWLPKAGSFIVEKL